MSRTFKDKPSRVTHDPYDMDRVMTETWHFRELPTTKTKKRKEVDTEWHWMSTPSNWTRLMMNRPERRAAHLQEVKALKVLDLEDIDFVDTGRKPHQYYY